MSAGSKTAPIHGVSGFVWRALTSSLGAKVVMAATGLGFYGWLVAHLAGNLGVFAGPETENAYAHFLKGNPEILWAQRLAWMSLLPIHILAGIRLSYLNKKARPQAYASRNWRQATLASRTMIISGLVVLAFVVFHLGHFTWIGWFNDHYAYDGNHLDPATGIPNVFGMVVGEFGKWPIAVIYIVGVSLIGFHLSHGLWSGVQSLGLNGRKWTPFAQKLGVVLAILVALGFAAIPLSIILGVVTDHEATAQTQVVPSSLVRR